MHDIKESATYHPTASWWYMVPIRLLGNRMSSKVKGSSQIYLLLKSRMQVKLIKVNASLIMNIPGSTTTPELNLESRIGRKVFHLNAATTLPIRNRNQNHTYPRGTRTFSLKSLAMTRSHAMGSSSRTSRRLALSLSLTRCWWQKSRKVNASQATHIS